MRYNALQHFYNAGDGLSPLMIVLALKGGLRLQIRNKKPIDAAASHRHGVRLIEVQATVDNESESCYYLSRERCRFESCPWLHAMRRLRAGYSQDLMLTQALAY